MLKFIQCLRQDKAGATAIEYALVAGVIAAVIVSAVAVVGERAVGMFNQTGAVLAPSAP